MNQTPQRRAPRDLSAPAAARRSTPLTALRGLQTARLRARAARISSPPPADGSSAGRQGLQQGSPAASGAAPGRTRSLKGSPAPAQASTAAPRPPSIASPRAPEHPAEPASSPGKSSSNPLSPKPDPHKPPAAVATSAGGHHKGSSPRSMPKAPSRKGDFLGQNASPASLQTAWSAGSGGRDDRMDQAASVMLVNQYYADAQSGGRN